jgi:hypothetical protein
MMNTTFDQRGGGSGRWVARLVGVCLFEIACAGPPRAQPTTPARLRIRSLRRSRPSERRLEICTSRRKTIDGESKWPAFAELTGIHKHKLRRRQLPLRRGSLRFNRLRIPQRPQSQQPAFRTDRHGVSWSPPQLSDHSWPRLSSWQRRSRWLAPPVEFPRRLGTRVLAQSCLETPLQIAATDPADLTGVRPRSVRGVHPLSSSSRIRIRRHRRIDRRLRPALIAASACRSSSLSASPGNRSTDFFFGCFMHRYRSFSDPQRKADPHARVGGLGRSGSASRSQRLRRPASSTPCRAAQGSELVVAFGNGADSEQERDPPVDVNLAGVEAVENDSAITVLDH